MRKASGSDGAYLPASMAMVVRCVTPAGTGPIQHFTKPVPPVCPLGNLQPAVYSLRSVTVRE